MRSNMTRYVITSKELKGISEQYYAIDRNRGGYPYWSLSAYIKHRVKGAVEFIGGFEHAVAHECIRRDYDGVICGHIHHAEIKDIAGIRYYNDGDWVESCTALVENFDGTIEIIKWHIINHEDNDSD